MNTTINQRIKEIADKLCNGNISEVARVVGVKQQTLRSIVTGKQNKPGFETLYKIAVNDKFEISADWLLRGKGEMQKSAVDVVNNHAVARLIPVYNLRAVGGLKALLESDRRQHILGEIKLLNMPSCDGAIYAWDDGMYPLLVGENIVAYKQLHSMDNLVKGEMSLVEFYLEGDHFLMIRYVQWEEMGETLRLVSYNKRYPDSVIPVSAVMAIAYVMAIVDIKTII